MNRALFAHSIAVSRDRGIASGDMQLRLATIVREHPETGIDQDDLNSMLALARQVYDEMKNLTPSQVKEVVITTCGDPGKSM